MSRDFTLKQKLFIEAYVATKNATAAAKMAGYSAKTARSAGSRLLTNVAIGYEIEDCFTRLIMAANISAKSIIEELRRAAFSNCGSNARKFRALELLGRAFGLFRASSAESAPKFSAADLLEHED